MIIYSSFSFPYGLVLDCFGGRTEATEEKLEKKKLEKKDKHSW